MSSEGVYGRQEPRHQTQPATPPPQLACGMLWLSGYSPLWSQNATDLLSSLLALLEQLGPTVSQLVEPRGRREWLGPPVPPAPTWGSSEFRRCFQAPAALLPAPTQTWSKVFRARFCPC